jgi:hypothetical protein
MEAMFTRITSAMNTQFTQTVTSLLQQRDSAPNSAAASSVPPAPSAASHLSSFGSSSPEASASLTELQRISQDPSSRVGANTHNVIHSPAIGNNNTVHSSFNHTVSPAVPSVDIPSTSCFFGVTGGLRPNPPGHTEMSLPQMLGLSQGNSKPYKTLEEFRQALLRWILTELQQHPSDTNRLINAVRYVTKIIMIGKDYHLSSLLAYHWSAVQASSLTPPQYNFMDNEVYWPGYLEHLAGLDKAVDAAGKRGFPTSSSSRGKTRVSKPTIGVKHERDRTSSDTGSDCSIHPGKGHSNASCFQQGGPRPKQPRSS